MAVFKPFRALRPAEEYAALIPDLPYDVVREDEARSVVAENPHSFLSVDCAECTLPPQTEPYSDAVYAQAAANLARLEQDGCLVQEKQPCFYIYKQTLGARSQTGIAGLASIDAYLNGQIKRHELTRAEKEQDRIRHIEACNADTGPIFLTYRQNHALDMLTSMWMSEHHPLYEFEKYDVRNTVWRVDDAQTIEKITEYFTGIDSLYIADGHHRCASAVHVGEKRRAENPGYTGEEPFNYFMCVAFAHNELEIMDYNRVVRDLNGLDVPAFLQKVGARFTINERTGGPFKSYKPFKRHTFGMYLDKKWYELEAKPEFIDESDPVARLDVSILQNNLLAPVLGVEDPRSDARIDFVGGAKGMTELERRTTKDMRVAFSLFPVTVEDLMAIADAGLIMPPKSTWFEPKLLSGLFIYSLNI